MRATPKHLLHAVLVALVVGLGPWLPTSAANAATGSLSYACGGPGFGDQASYPFHVTLDTDVPATLPYGWPFDTVWTAQVVAPDTFRQWAEDQGFTHVFAAARITPVVDGTPLTHSVDAGTLQTAVPTDSGDWTWSGSSTYQPARLPTAVVGHHVVTAGLQLTVYYQDDGQSVGHGSATCTLDPSVPAADTVVDAYDVVAAATTTTVTVVNRTAVATVTALGAPVEGTVAFSVGARTVTGTITAGQARVRLPVLPPGEYDVVARFTPSSSAHWTASSGTAVGYDAPRLRTSTRAGATYRVERHLVTAKALVTAAGFDVSGRVTFVLKRNNVPVQSATASLADEGVARRTFRGVTRPGAYVVVARFIANDTFARSSDRTAQRLLTRT